MTSPQTAWAIPSVDYVTDEHSKLERKFYDQTYESGGWATQQPLDEVDFESLWQLEPASIAYLESLGDVRGKRILVLGNGTSVKEFLLVERGARVTFTDLSYEAMKQMKKRYEASELGKKYVHGAEFHGVNAYELPFKSGSFDIVCADAVIHHLDDLEKLFSGVARVLKPGGFCRFADTAYSSLWQGAKGGILKKLQRRVHAEQGISPEDQKATERGGYTLPEMNAMLRVGFKSVYYQRVALLDYLLWRMRCKLQMSWVLKFRPMIRFADRMLAHTPIMRTQGISLICGFDK